MISRLCQDVRVGRRRRHVGVHRSARASHRHPDDAASSRLTGRCQRASRLLDDDLSGNRGL